MSEESELADTIRTAAASPASASVDGESVTARPLKDLIEADRHLGTVAAQSTANKGVRFSRFVPPGAA